MPDDVEPPGELIGGTGSDELSSNRTAMSFARTELAGDRTLMAIMRTALSLIGFGFTIFQFFRTLQSQILPGQVPSGAPARFGLALVALGVLLLILGIFGHWRNARLLRHRRERLYRLRLMRNLPRVGVSAIWVVAIALLLIGLLAIARIAFSEGPF